MKFSFKNSLFMACLIMVLVPSLVATVLFTRAGENYYLKYEKRCLQSITMQVDASVKYNFSKYYVEKGALNASREEKINVLKQGLTPRLLRLVSGYTDVQVGVYSQELNALVATAPLKYEKYIGVGITERHPGWEVLKGKEFASTKNLIRPGILCYFRPLRRDGKIIGYVFASRDLKAVNSYVNSIYRYGIMVAAISLLTGMGITFFMYKKFFSQIETIIKGVKSLSASLHHRLPSMRGELGEVAEAINSTAASVEENQNFTELLLENDIGGIIAIDKDCIIRKFNKKAGEIMEVNPQKFLGEDYIKLFAKVFPGDDSLLIKSVQKGKAYLDVVKEITSTYQAKTCSINTYPISTRDGVIEGAILLLLDITEKLALEEKLRQADKFAVVGQLAAGTAHEIRNPLTSVRGFLQLMGERLREDGNIQEYISIMMTEIDRINSIIKEFLLLAKPTHPCRTLVDISDVMREIALLLESEALLHNIALEITQKKPVPQVNIDVEQLKQVFINLGKNAMEAMMADAKLAIQIKHNPAKEVITEEGVKVMETVAVSFINNGPQIPRKSLAKIFDPFFTTKESGTGLGLTVSYQIVRNHGGTISVKSTPARTTFTVELPV